LDYTIRDLFAPPISPEFYGWIHRGVHLAWYQTRVTFPLSPGRNSRSSVLLGRRRRLLLTVSDPTTHLSSSTRPASPQIRPSACRLSPLFGFICRLRSMPPAPLLRRAARSDAHRFTKLCLKRYRSSSSPCSSRAQRCHVPAGRRLSRACRALRRLA
jgi:hypothetical protein